MAGVNKVKRWLAGDVRFDIPKKAFTDILKQKNKNNKIWKEKKEVFLTSTKSQSSSSSASLTSKRQFGGTLHRLQAISAGLDHSWHRRIEEDIPVWLNRTQVGSDHFCCLVFAISSLYFSLVRLIFSIRIAAVITHLAISTAQIPVPVPMSRILDGGSSRETAWSSPPMLVMIKLWTTSRLLESMLVDDLAEASIGS